MESLSSKHPKWAQPLPDSQLNKHTLYISGEQFIKNLGDLEKLKIGAVLSLTQDSFSLPAYIEHTHITVSDHPDADISQHLNVCYEFIENKRKQTNVLVHCVAGVSRSATVCLYYLMRKYRWSLEVSLARLRQCRPWVRPNDGFLGKLRQEERKMGLGFGKSCF